jgi:hypothetical protein
VWSGKRYVMSSVPFGIILTSMSQTVQRLADSWRNVIGSTGISTMLSFCDSQALLRDSDSERQKFATHELVGYRFMYKDTRHENNKVCKPGCYPVGYASNM